MALLRASLLLALLLISAAVHAKPGPWELITNEKGVKVQAREIPGQGLPEFRGIGMVKGSIYEVLAVIDDTANHPKWLANCVEAKKLKQLDAPQMLLFLKALLSLIELRPASRQLIHMQYTACHICEFS